MDSIRPFQNLGARFPTRREQIHSTTPTQCMKGPPASQTGAVSVEKPLLFLICNAVEKKTEKPISIVEGCRHTGHLQDKGSTTERAAIATGH
jgi:hypothetical protein